MFPATHRARIVAALLAGVATVVLAAEPPVVTRENAFTFYHGFVRLTDKPRPVSPELATLCVRLTPERVEAEERKKGPHAQALIHLYVNPAAADAINHRQTVFPPGAVVIKEKLSGNEAAPDAVGGMIKHAPGYDPENGDWEYFYCEKDGAPTSGRLANCAACHAGAKATDYVFSVWNPDRAPAR